MYIVGLTGGIGSGKSAAADEFRRLGIDVVDADQVSRLVVEPGEPALDAIAGHFGAGILLSDGTLDRKALRKKVFSSEPDRKWLETLLHPLINQRIWQQLENTRSPYAILETPLLFETEQWRMSHRNLVIDVPKALQISRAAMRDQADPKQIKEILKAQMSREQRCQRTDDVILNDGDLNQLKSNVKKLHNRYLKLAKQHHEQT